MSTGVVEVVVGGYKSRGSGCSSRGSGGSSRGL